MQLAPILSAGRHFQIRSGAAETECLSLVASSQRDDPGQSTSDFSLDPGGDPSRSESLALSWVDDCLSEALRADGLPGVRGSGTFDLSVCLRGRVFAAQRSPVLPRNPRNVCNPSLRRVPSPTQALTSDQLNRQAQPESSSGSSTRMANGSKHEHTAHVN